MPNTRLINRQTRFRSREINRIDEWKNMKSYIAKFVETRRYKLFWHHFYNKSTFLKHVKNTVCLNKNYITLKGTLSLLFTLQAPV